jgi:hypothetical protein
MDFKFPSTRPHIQVKMDKLSASEQTPEINPGVNQAVVVKEQDQKCDGFREMRIWWSIVQNRHERPSQGVRDEHTHGSQECMREAPTLPPLLKLDGSSLSSSSIGIPLFIRLERCGSEDDDYILRINESRTSAAQRVMTKNE